MKNIVFDLGGVLFARDKSKCTPELLEFFSFLRTPRMPLFWEEYDRGTSTLEEVTATISGMTGRPVETCAAVLRLAVDLQEPVKPTERLVGDLKAAGYRLYVLSNMSREFIDFLRRFPVYGLFDGEVVSCEEHTVKPEPRIYEILLERYGLTPSETTALPICSGHSRLRLRSPRSRRGVRRPAPAVVAIGLHINKRKRPAQTGLFLFEPLPGDQLKV